MAGDAAPSGSTNGSGRPGNLLFLMSDQHSRRVLGAYGNPLARTPNLDRIALAGTRFTNAYTTSPVCVPARASLATGRYPHTLGLWDNTTPYTGCESESWGHRLERSGYHVTTIGKLHYRRSSDPTGFPDQRIPLHVQDGVGGVVGLLRGDAPSRSTMRDVVVRAGAGESEYTRYDRAIGVQAQRWLEREAPLLDRPWALFVSFASPHHPWVCPDEYLQSYEAIRMPDPIQGDRAHWPRHPALGLLRHQQQLDVPFDDETVQGALRSYYGLVQFMDDQVGAVLTGLRHAGLESDTSVVYTSDHGDTLGDHGLWFKSSMYEGSVGVPLLVAGPGVPRGRVCGTPTSSIDVVPTLLEIAGIESASAQLPGTSLLSLANRPDDPTRMVFSEYHGPYSMSGIFMIRAGRYKYVHYLGMASQLFDMVADPSELDDLAGRREYDAVRDECERALRTVVDPERADAAARSYQARRLSELGGRDAVIDAAQGFAHSPPPVEFL